MESGKKERLFKYYYNFNTENIMAAKYLFVIIPHIIQHTKKELHLISLCRAWCHHIHRSIASQLKIYTAIRHACTMHCWQQSIVVSIACKTGLNLNHISFCLRPAITAYGIDRQRSNEDKSTSIVKLIITMSRIL